MMTHILNIWEMVKTKAYLKKKKKKKKVWEVQKKSEINK